MSRKVCVYQPGYFQPLHYFARIFNSDVFVSLAGAQLNRKVNQGRAFVYDGVLTVPISGGNRQSITDSIPCYEQGWVAKHEKMLKQMYSNATYFEDTMNEIMPMLLMAEHEKWSLARIGIETVGIVMDIAGWHGEIYEVAERPEGLTASKWMLDVTKGAGGDTYVCGEPALTSYLDLKDFAWNNVAVEVQNWKCPPYNQKGSEFKPNLSILDLLMHEDTDTVVKVLKGVQS